MARPSTGLVGAAGLGALLSQVVLNGGPPVLSALGGGEAEVTALFAALALFRAPYLVALGLTVRVTAPLTRRVAERGRAGLRRPALAVAGGSVALAGAAFAAARPLGPPLVRALFGPGTDLAGPATGGVAAGCVLALGSLVLTVMLIAASARGTLVGAWGLATAAAVVVLTLGGGLAPAARVVTAFVVAEGVATLASLPGLWRWRSA